MTDPTPVTAPAAATLPAPSGAVLTLTAPEPVTAVPQEKVAGMVTLDTEALPGLDAKVAAFVTTLSGLDVHSPEFAKQADDVRTMGDAEIRASAETSNRLLQAPVRAMQQGGLADTSKVAESLVELRRTVEDLDPAHASGVRKILGLIPFGNKLRAYFQRFESAQSHINAIIQALYSGQDELGKDNAALDQEKLRLWESMQRLAQYVYLASRLDEALTAKVAEVELSDPERAKALNGDILFYVRQKHQDLLTQLAVSIQGYLAIDMVKRNNLELIKGVDRATTTTISALRTAVIVAQALGNQKLVLNQIDALNTTTSKMIQSTAELLATQSVEINKQASSSTIDLEALKSAFANVKQAMDAIDTFKLEALGTMSTTIGALQTEINGAQEYLGRVRDTDAREASGALDLDA